MNMETKIIELSEFEMMEIEGGSFIAVACCAIAFATGLATALMIL